MRDELCDVEHHTACRRLLAEVAAGDAHDFRHPRARLDTAAAAVAWIVGKANESLDSHGAGLSIGELVDMFGVPASPSTQPRPC